MAYSHIGCYPKSTPATNCSLEVDLFLEIIVDSISNFIVSTTFPTLADISLGVAYGLYTIFALVSLLFVYKFVQETKGKQLEDMV